MRFTNQVLGAIHQPKSLTHGPRCVTREPDARITDNINRNDCS
jgi:hypothetical protein